MPTKNDTHVHYTGSPEPNRMTEKTTIEKTLPELIGGFVKGAMENAANLNQYGRDLQEWYEARAQVVENRQQLVLDTEKAIERAKGSLEYLFSEYRRMSAKDR